MRLAHLAVVAALTVSAAACSNSKSSSPAAAPPAATATATGIGSTSDATVATATTTPASTVTSTVTATATAASAGTELATALALSAAQATQTTASCGALTLKTVDATGTVQALVNARTVNLTSSATTGAFYSDSGCATTSASASLAVGSTSSTVYYKDSALGSPTLTATDATTSVPALTAGTLAVSIVQSTPSQLGFTNAALSQADGACGALTVSVLDAGGAPLPYSTTSTFEILLQTSSAQGHFYSTSTCTNLILATFLGTNSATTQVYYKDLAGGTPTLTASSLVAGITAGTQTETITAGTATHLAIVNPVVSSSLANCLPINLELDDSAGAAVQATADLPVTLTTSSNTTGFFYSDSRCLNRITGASFATGSADATVYYHESIRNRTDVLTISDGSSAGLTAASETVLFQ